MSKVVIFGSGRGADQAFRYLSKDSPHEICAFTVDSQYLKDSTFNGLPVVDFETIESRYPPEEYKMFTPLGFQKLNKIRCQKYTEGKEKGFGFISYINSNNYLLEDLEMGENCFILENQSINLDVKIGNNVTIWSGSQIGDSTVIMDHCWISSHACIAANAVIKPFCFLGINASVSHNITIETECFIGANSLITKNTDPKGVYIVESTKKSVLPSDKFMAMVRDTI